MNYAVRRKQRMIVLSAVIAAAPARSPIISIDHETGDLSQYTSTTTDSGDLSVTAEAALAGTGYGLQVVVNDTTAIFGTYRPVLSTTGVLRSRFYIDPNSITTSDVTIGDWVWYVTNNTPSGFASVILGYASSSYQIMIGLRNDAGTWSYSSKYPITDAPHYIEVLVRRAANSASNDGTMQLWIDGVSQTTISSIDNYDRLSNFYEVRIGDYTPSSATSGTFYIDELIVRDDDTEIGPVVGASLMLTRLEAEEPAEIVSACDEERAIPVYFGIPLCTKWTWDHVLVPVINLYEGIRCSDGK